MTDTRDWAYLWAGSTNPGSDLLLSQGGDEYAAEVGVSATTWPQTGCAALYRCPARAVVAPSPYWPTPTATTAGVGSRVVLGPSGEMEVSRMR